MSITRPAHPRVPPELFGAMLFLILGCYTWKVNQVPTARAFAGEPRRSRVVRADGSVQDIFAPRFAAESLIGTSSPRPDATRVAVALSDVRSLSVREPNPAGTVGLLVAAVGVTGAIIAASSGRRDAPQGGGTSGGGSGYGSGEFYSCPLVYSWTPAGWRLDSGTFGGAISAGLARTDVDNLLYAAPLGGLIRLKVANELNETDHVDALMLVAVDHPAGTTVAPDADGGVHTLRALSLPRAAHDYRGRDALARIAAVDGWNWESNPTGRDSSRSADIRDGLELTFARPAGARIGHLVVDANVTKWAAYLMGQFVAAHGTATRAWYDSLDTRQGYAGAVQRALASEAFLTVSVLTDTGWTRQGLAWDVGPEISKRQVVELDLSRVTDSMVRVRLESVPSFWLIDAVGLGLVADEPMQLHEVRPVSAVGVDGRDVRAILSSADRSELVLETGDSAIANYPVPATVQGMSRSYLLRAHGWYRLNADESAAPDVATLQQITRARLGISRVATSRLAGGVASLAGAGR